jgi:diguanylate cyclase (GGDEF)-like protein
MNSANPGQEQVPTPIHDLRASLKELDRRDWSLWFTAITILLLLCFAVFSFSMPALWQHKQPLRQEELEAGIKGLFALVLLFAIFALYQQYMVKHLRAELQDKMVALSELHGRADTFERLAILDPLTGLFNRHFAVEYLPQEIGRCDRTDRPLTVVMIEFDDLQGFTETFGRAAGDGALGSFARHVKKAIRSADLPVRMGEGEFMVILPECDLENASRPIERIRGRVCTEAGETIPIKFSIVGVEHRRGESTSELLERADATLYEHERYKQGSQPVRSVDLLEPESTADCTPQYWNSAI